MLRHITIKRLFYLYDYEIAMTSGDGNPIQDIMFLTGPNGMGKSTILRSVASVYKREFGYFSTFPFERMTFDFDDCTVDITQNITIEEVEEDSDIPGSKTVRIVCDYLTKGKHPVSEHGEWGYRDGVKLAIPVSMPNMEMMFNSPKCLYISDHRLMEGADDAVVHPNLVISVLRDIQALFSEGYAAPAGDEVPVIGRKERTQEVKEVMLLLSDCEVVLPIDMTAFNDEATVSNHQLVCCENAIRNCGDRILRLQGFRQFVETSKFLGKRYRITMSNGLQFYAENEERSMLGFDRLSLGEQHIISQIYTMFFSPMPFQLVLVDEPELSFHLMWQMQYLGNIRAVQNMRKCAFLIATHSTQVFEGKFELTTDLFSQMNH
jgi:energy-coupling factor transporter ATP-binding protein EcfA2